MRLCILSSYSIRKKTLILFGDFLFYELTKNGHRHVSLHIIITCNDQKNADTFWGFFEIFVQNEDASFSKKIKNYAVALKLFFSNLEHYRVNPLFCKILGLGIQKWTFLKMSKFSK